MFLAVVFVLYWSITGQVLRKALLLGASYVFYAAWDWRFLSLIGLSTAICYLCALGMAQRPADDRARFVLLWIGITANLSILGIFKYFGFFADAAAELAGLLGASLSRTTTEIVLPVGISFYTFQALSYVIDVYRRATVAERSALNVALYLAFFPQLVAGPIVRATTFLPQLHETKRISDVRFKWYLALFLSGFVKKAVISDNLAPYVDGVFGTPQEYHGLGVALGVLLYSVQIFCDFSGYSDMAIASAGMLGFRFLPNFAAPYLATSIRDFWHRWHISLSTWLRDYLYIPLGGNRRGTWRRDLNVLITMALGGLWHGAFYTFVLWGTLHGVALVLERHAAGWLARAGDTLPARLTGALLTFLFVSAAWILFRAPDLATAWHILTACVTLQGSGSAGLGLPALGLFAGLGLAYAWACRAGALERAAALPDRPFAIGLGVATALAVAFLPTDYRPFIYFQF